MRRLILFGLLFLSAFSQASELMISHHYLHMNKTGLSGRLTQLGIKSKTNDQFSFGFSSTYLERFDLYELNFGPQLNYKFNDRIFLEARYLKARSGPEILPNDHYLISMYHALAPGYSILVSYQNLTFSQTHAQWFRVGFEIEKIKNLIIIPHSTIGQAHFHHPYSTQEINSFGLRLISDYFENYRMILYGSKGLEASQALIGRSSQTIETKTIGGGWGWIINKAIKIDALFDYTDLGKLDNQFLTTTLNLNWIF